MDLRKIRVNPLPKEVEDWCNEHSLTTTTKFVAYLQYIRGEMVERTFATRVGKGKIRITEVMRHATGKHTPIVRNLISGGMSGYRAVYKAEDYVIRSWGYPITVFSKSDFNIWFPLAGAVGFGYVTINPQAIFTADEFKYCGYTTGSVISYLNAYRKDKNVEFFGKMGLQLSPKLMNKAKKDGKFRRFLWDNHNAIALFGVQAGLYAYKNNITVEEARRACYEKNKLIASICAAPMIFGKMGLLKGKKATCYPGFEEHFNGGEYTGELVSVCENVITGKGAGAAMLFGAEIVNYFEKDKGYAILKEMQHFTN